MAVVPLRGEPWWENLQHSSEMGEYGLRLGLGPGSNSDFIDLLVCDFEYILLSTNSISHLSGIFQVSGSLLSSLIQIIYLFFCLSCNEDVVIPT